MKVGKNLFLKAPNLTITDSIFFVEDESHFQFKDLKVSICYIKSKNKFIIENISDHMNENFLKKIVIYQSDNQDLSFLKIKGNLSFADPMSGLLCIAGTNKVELTFKSASKVLNFLRYLRQELEFDINRANLDSSTNIIDLPTGFDALCYLHMYQDLYDHAETLSSDDEKRNFAINHYLTSRESEGRKYFDPFAYLYLYEDLYNAAEKLSTDDEKRTFAIWHFLTFSKNEGRKYLEILPENFDASCYLYYYEDLYYVAETLSSDEDKKKFALKHYLRYGKSEGRKYFNPFTYLRLN